MKSDTLQDIPGPESQCSSNLGAAYGKNICLLVITGKHWGQVNLTLCIISSS